MGYSLQFNLIFLHDSHVAALAIRQKGGKAEGLKGGKAKGAKVAEEAQEAKGAEEAKEANTDKALPYQGNIPSEYFFAFLSSSEVFAFNSININTGHDPLIFKITIPNKRKCIRIENHIPPPVENSSVHRSQFNVRAKQFLVCFAFALTWVYGVLAGMNIRKREIGFVALKYCFLIGQKRV